MAKTFNNLKTKLGLLDFITIGKYKNCRVDSIIETDYEYLIYMDKEKVIQFAPEVLDRLKHKFSAYSLEVRPSRVYPAYPDSYDMINGVDMALEIYDYEDIPF